jgi:DNA invertase Pin-like site-specific DNA recombinase
LLEELKEQGVGLHMIDLGGDVIGNGVSKMVFTILAAVAEGERDRLRERIRDAKRHLARKAYSAEASAPSAMTSCWMAMCSGSFPTRPSRI